MSRNASGIPSLPPLKSCGHEYTLPEKAISMKDLTGFTNTLLRSRGENREYSPEELGIRLKNEGLCRRRRNSGMVLVFDRPTQRSVHQMARSLGVGKSVAECPDCSDTKIVHE